MDKFRQISTELLPLIRVENWFSCFIPLIFLAHCLPTLYMSWYLIGVVGYCRWVIFVKFTHGYYP